MVLYYSPSSASIDPDSLSITQHSLLDYHTQLCSTVLDQLHKPAPNITVLLSCRN